MKALEKNHCGLCRGLSEYAKKGVRSVASLLLATVIISSTFLLGGCFGRPTVDPIDDNYRTFYQIFVGSFSDSDGDGIGDIRGIIDRLDYLNDGDVNRGKDLGVQGIWLSPIFSSPTYHKYDADDYYKIDEDFGTEADLKELVDLCHQRNVKVILDLVINHTSIENQWFEQFKEARRTGDTESKYYDYYTCVDSSSMKGGSSYGGLGFDDLWYECNFDSRMPELNFDSPAVREDILSLAKYYLDLGIDGFRFDAVKYIYYGDAERSIDFWKWYMGELTAYKPDIYCVGECWSAESEILAYSEALNCFNFSMAGSEGKVAYATRGKGVSSFVNYVESYQDQLQAINPKGMPMSFISNHDMDRIAGSFISDGQKKMAASLYLLSPGSPTIYYGEEIGIKGSKGSAHTDANRRLAMLWGDGDSIKNPVGSTYSDASQIDDTVKDQLKDGESILRHYSKVISVRNKYPAIARGDYFAMTCDNKGFAGFSIQYNGEIIGLFHNATKETVTIDLSSMEGGLSVDFSKVCECLGEGKASIKDGVLTVEAYTSVIVK